MISMKTKNSNKGGGVEIKEKIMKLMIMVFIILFVVSVYFLIKDFLAYQKSNHYNKKLIKEVVLKDDKADETEKNKDKENPEEKLQLDWTKLEKINRDIIGWIKIEDTNINYPILKDTTNLKYLKHTYDGKYNANGAIFTLNENPFEDNITVVYGHNTKTGLMFSQLGQYMKQDFFEKHNSFKIDTKKNQYRATIFSCYSIGIETEENNIKSLNFEEEIAYYKKQSKYLVKNIGEINKIVKLSTCSYLNSHTIPTNQRYYILAKLEEIK